VLKTKQKNCETNVHLETIPNLESSSVFLVYVRQYFIWTPQLSFLCMIDHQDWGRNNGWLDLSLLQIS